MCHLPLGRLILPCQLVVLILALAQCVWSPSPPPPRPALHVGTGGLALQLYINSVSRGEMEGAGGYRQHP